MPSRLEKSMIAKVHLYGVPAKGPSFLTHTIFDKKDIDIEMS